MCPCALSGTEMKKKKKILLTFLLSNYFVLFSIFLYLIEEIMLLNYNLSVFIMLVPNCPGAKLSGAKLSGAKSSYHPYQYHLILT